MSLDNPENVARVAAIIAAHDPDVIVFDSLYNFAAGDLNSDEGMATTLQAITRLVRRGRPDRACILIHHAIAGRAGAARAVGYDRAGFARNSKVLLAWTRAQINVAPGAPDNNDLLVISCGKNSNGREFPKFAACLSPEMIYETNPSFDMQAWEGAINSRTDRDPIMTAERVAELCAPLTSKADLAKAIQEDCGCSRATSFRYVAKAKGRTIKENRDGTYSRK